MKAAAVTVPRTNTSTSTNMDRNVDQRKKEKVKESKRPQRMEAKDEEEGNTDTDTEMCYIPPHLQRWSGGAPGWELIPGRNRQQKKIENVERYPKCPFCHKPRGKQVSTWNWNRHLNVIHWFRCKHCGLHFTAIDKMKQHLASHH